MALLEDVIQRPNFTIEASAQVAVDQLDNLNDMPSAPLHSSPFINSISSPIASVLPVTPKSAQDWSISPAHHGSSRVNVRERPPIRRDSALSPKPMKPLASFFNEFIQNIRNVTVSANQPPVSDKHLVSKRSLRKVSRSSGEPFDKHPLDRMTSFAPLPVMFRTQSTSEWYRCHAASASCSQSD